MLFKRRVFSYADQKKRKYIFLKLFLWISVFFFLHLIITNFVIETIRIESTTMQPDLQLGDHLIVLKFGFGKTAVPLDTESHKLERGNIVLVNANAMSGESQAVLSSVFERILSFFSLRRFSSEYSRKNYILQRLVAIPGDEISMERYVFRIRPEGEPWALTEYEVTDSAYNIKIENTPEGWTNSSPLSDTMPVRILSKDEWFLASDSRSNYNDSRTWGPVSYHSISGKLIFRYWPLHRFGRM